MGTFLNDEAREHLIEQLTSLGMPQEMAEKFASWPDNADELDARLTALINQTAKYKDQIDGGDKPNAKFIIAAAIMLISYMDRASERGWNELQLPMMNEAMKGHNQRWHVGSIPQ